MNKYRNVKTVVGGIQFDSKREASRWQELKLLERAGKIAGLKRQVEYILAPSVKFEGAKRAQPAMRIKVDFAYQEITRTGAGMSWSNNILEDTKSPATVTTAFTMRRHLLKHIHGLDIRLTK